MAEERDPIRYAANRAAWRVVAEARQFAEEEPAMVDQHPRLRAALHEVSRFVEPGGVAEIMPGEPHYPEDWPV